MLGLRDVITFKGISAFGESWVAVKDTMGYTDPGVRG